ncbi:hypothetical protein [Nocardia sp. XZ_19_231]|uniref:hypothetical protein n=1 Tax=Nocardia sp. XZ_19_231 TaxID=2769252 RepID=UPI00188ED67C|nr:hypothetical protein [Nocardia sp. XZ_19_231]
MTSPHPPNWNDLLEALALLATHGTDTHGPLACYHDVLVVGSDPDAYTPEEQARLAELGFIADIEDGTFTSFRFGSP